MLYSLKIPGQKAFCHVTLILAWWCEPSWFHQDLSYTAQRYNKEMETSKQEKKKRKEGGEWAIFYLWFFPNLPKSKGLTVKVSFILANYVPMSAGTKGKTGGREEERERNVAPLKLNLTCSFSSKLRAHKYIKEHYFQSVLQIFRVVWRHKSKGCTTRKTLRASSTNLTDTKPVTEG